MNTVYLDYNATTPIDTDVLEAMLPFLEGLCANPSSIHAAGQRARNAVEMARIHLAEAINADPKEIIFTGSGSEGNNLAIKGALAAARSPAGHIVTTPIEHSSIRATLSYVSKLGARITEVPVDRHGRVEPADVEKAIGKETVLVTIGHSNNEIGTVQPIEPVAQIARDRGVLLHTDAVQSMGKIPVDVKALGVDMLSLSAHKFYGPKGVGVLYVRQGVVVEPLVHGGGQESRLRAGTENVPGVVGMAKAARIASQRVLGDRERYLALRRQIEQDVVDRIPGAKLHGHPEYSLPQTINMSFEGIDGLSLQIRLDLAGFAVSTGSACSSGSSELSHVQAALGEPTAPSAIRVSLGRKTTSEDCRAFVNALEQSVKELSLI